MIPRLVSLKINHLRHVEAGTTIAFSPNFNIVVGENGTGKTTLLEVISAIFRNNFSVFADEPFEIEFSLSHSGLRLDCNLKNHSTKDSLGFRPPLAPQLRARLSSDNKELLALESDVAASSIMQNGVRSSGPTVLPAFTTTEAYRFPLFYNILKLLNSPETIDLRAMGQLLTEKHLSCVRVGEGTETFNQLFNADDEQGSSLDLFITDIRGETHTITPHLPESTTRSLLERLAPRGTTFSAPDSITIDATELPALQAFVELSQYHAARLTLVLRESDSKAISWSYGEPLVRLQMANGNQIPHSHMSFGEKRLLTFLIKLFACPSTIIVDELANGMHHSWIEQIIALLEDHNTQAFLTSQNPLLLDYIPLTEETYLTQHTFVICETTDSGALRWRNMSLDESTDFFKSLAVGLERISEIMRSKGLW